MISDNHAKSENHSTDAIFYHFFFFYITFLELLTLVAYISVAKSCDKPVSTNYRFNYNYN